MTIYGEYFRGSGHFRLEIHEIIRWQDLHRPLIEVDGFDLGYVMGEIDMRVIVKIVPQCDVIVGHVTMPRIAIMPFMSPITVFVQKFGNL